MFASVSHSLLRYLNNRSPSRALRRPTAEISGPGGSSETGPGQGAAQREAENAKQFRLGQSFPDPYVDEVTIPFILRRPADVSVSLWTPAGKKFACFSWQGLKTGDHYVNLNVNAMGIHARDCIYQIEVVNGFGRFRDSKRMTASLRR